MYDINKYIAHEALAVRDPAGHLAELPHWSPLVANRCAEEDGLALTEAHWEVIYCLRQRYCDCGPEWTAREITRELAHEYAESGGLRYLYTLFPRGPLAQGCRMAGVPLPHGTVNRSFGSVH